MTVSPSARDQELYVRCKSCDFAIASGLRRDPRSSATPERRAHHCPRCGASRTYESGDYVRRDELETEKAPAE